MEAYGEQRWGSTCSLPQWKMLGYGRSAVAEGFLLTNSVAGWIDHSAERDVAKKTATVDRPVHIAGNQPPYLLKARTHHSVGMRLPESLVL
jgi:hypothetical protein